MPKYNYYIYIRDFCISRKASSFQSSLISFFAMMFEFLCLQNYIFFPILQKHHLIFIFI